MEGVNQEGVLPHGTFTRLRSKESTRLPGALLLRNRGVATLDSLFPSALCVMNNFTVVQDTGHSSYIIFPF